MNYTYTECQRTNSITDLRSHLIGRAEYIYYTPSNAGGYRSPFYSQFTVQRVQLVQAAQKLLRNFLSLKFAVFYAISIYKRVPKAAICTYVPT